jgi:hypothetical protein
MRWLQRRFVGRGGASGRTGSKGGTGAAGRGESAGLEKKLKDFSAMSYRPSLIVGYADQGSSRHLAVWVRDGKTAAKAPDR